MGEWLKRVKFFCLDWAGAGDFVAIMVRPVVVNLVRIESCARCKSGVRKLDHKG